MRTKRVWPKWKISYSQIWLLQFSNFLFFSPLPHYLIYSSFIFVLIFLFRSSLFNHIVFSSFPKMSLKIFPQYVMNQSIAKKNLAWSFKIWFRKFKYFPFNFLCIWSELKLKSMQLSVTSRFRYLWKYIFVNQIYKVTLDFPCFDKHGSENWASLMLSQNKRWRTYI